MRCWYFSEMAYHPAWEAGLERGTLRVVLPSSNFDPPTAHGLLNRYLALTGLEFGQRTRQAKFQKY